MLDRDRPINDQTPRAIAIRGGALGGGHAAEPVEKKSNLAVAGVKT